jgi:hypothetical protein
MCDVLVTQSYEAIRKEFGISRGQLDSIVAQGISENWPPFADGRPKYSNDAEDMYTSGPESLPRAERLGIGLSARMRER